VAPGYANGSSKGSTAGDIRCRNDPIRRGALADWGIDLDMDGHRPNRSTAGSEWGTCGSGSMDSAIAELANRQRGLVSRTQLLDVGLTRNAIDARLRSGRLHPIYRGVYLVGHAVPLPGARELGAILACGRGAVISHRTAAALWRLLPNRDREVHVTVPGRDCRRSDGIRIHRVAALDRRDVRKLSGIPITSPARTILDIAGSVSTRELEQAVAEAEARRLVRRSELRSLVARVGPRRGVAPLRSLLGTGARPALTRSEAEERLLTLIKAAELPLPETNVLVAGHEVDFLWREAKLVVEVDGFQFHGSRTAFERDRERDAAIAGLGYRVVRVTWRRIVDRPGAVVAAIAAALVARA
jgi:very-short-patch-repair endonuclease